MSKVEEGKFVRMFDRSEIRFTACAVSKNTDTNFLFGLNKFVSYFIEPNQFWKKDPNHERACIKVYRGSMHNHSLCYDATQIVKIPMSFLGHDSSDGWGELQFLIKAPRLVKLARHRSFDISVNQWVEETKLIQPKTDFGNHAYLALRFYHQDHLPPVPDNWHWEPVYVSVLYLAGNLMRLMFYRIDVLWEKEKIKITVTVLDENLPEIPKHLNNIEVEPR